MGKQAKEIKTMKRKVVEMEETVADLLWVVVQQESVMALCSQEEKGLARVFTWSTNSTWSPKNSDSCTFTDGVNTVRGHCFSQKQIGGKNVTSMGFTLDEGPVCTMHFECSILDKDDKVLRVVSTPENADLEKTPEQTAPKGRGRGASFILSEEDKAGAVRADGSIKLRMVVFLYLPELVRGLGGEEGLAVEMVCIFRARRGDRCVTTTPFRLRFLLDRRSHQPTSRCRFVLTISKESHTSFRDQ